MCIGPNDYPLAVGRDKTSLSQMADLFASNFGLDPTRSSDSRPTSSSVGYICPGILNQNRRVLLVSFHPQYSQLLVAPFSCQSADSQGSCSWVVQTSSAGPIAGESVFPLKFSFFIAVEPLQPPVQTLCAARSTLESRFSYLLYRCRILPSTLPSTWPLDHLPPYHFSSPLSLLNKPCWKRGSLLKLIAHRCMLPVTARAMLHHPCFPFVHHRSGNCYFPHFTSPTDPQPEPSLHLFSSTPPTSTFSVSPMDRSTIRWTIRLVCSCS